MNDIRWFAANDFTRLVVSQLRARGLEIATDGDEPARLAVAMTGSVMREAWRYAASRRVQLVQYVWDLPPWHLGRGRWDPVWSIQGRMLRLPRVGRRYRQRRGYLSALHYVVKHARAAWTPSAFSRAQVERQFGVTCAEVPYCYDSRHFADPGGKAVPQEALPNEDTARLLSVSRLERYKNHATVVRAAAAFDPPRPVTLIGRGSERTSLERLAGQLEVPLTITAGLSAADLRRAYRAAGVVVCPSTHEGMGLTPVEAAACGGRVVASDIPPHREFLQDRVEFFPPMDAEALVAAIRRAESAPPNPGPFDHITIEAAGARYFQALAALLNR